MRALFSGVIFGFLTTQPVAVGAEVKPINVLNWLDGCAALTVSAHGSTMDLSCLVSAERYCGFHGQLDAVDNCFERLTEHLNKKAVEISKAIKITEGIPDYSRRGIEITLKNNLQGRDPLECLPKWSPARCSSGRAAMNWLNWRGLYHRIEYVLKRQDKK